MSPSALGYFFWGAGGSPWVFFHRNKNPFYVRVKVKVIPDGGLTVRYLLVHWVKVTFNTHTHDDQKKWWRAAHEHRRRTETEKPAASSHLSQPSSNSQGTNRNNHKASVAAEKKWLQIPANLDWEKNENKLKCFFFLNAEKKRLRLTKTSFPDGITTDWTSAHVSVRPQSPPVCIRKINQSMKNTMESIQYSTQNPLFYCKYAVTEYTLSSISVVFNFLFIGKRLPKEQ